MKTRMHTRFFCIHHMCTHHNDNTGVGQLRDADVQSESFVQRKDIRQQLQTNGWWKNERHVLLWVYTRTYKLWYLFPIEQIALEYTEPEIEGGSGKASRHAVWAGFYSSHNVKTLKRHSKTPFEPPSRFRAGKNSNVICFIYQWLHVYGWQDDERYVLLWGCMCIYMQ
jgi:hypothetical protein